MVIIKDLKMKFKDADVLNGINLEMEDGHVYGIVGNNGSGKTVLFKCICGFLQPTEGCVVVNEKIIGKDVDFPQSLGVIIENPGFIPHYSAYRNLKLLADLNRKIEKEKIREVLACVGLDPDSKRPVSGYSLGMRQRLGIAQAIMEDPQLLILDEPFNGLDKQGVVEIRELIKGLMKENKIMILASHNQADIDYLCDAVYEMDRGVLTQVR